MVYCFGPASVRGRKEAQRDKNCNAHVQEPFDPPRPSFREVVLSVSTKGLGNQPATLQSAKRRQEANFRIGH